jgi:hypothetical protein
LLGLSSFCFMAAGYSFPPFRQRPGSSWSAWWCGCYITIFFTSRTLGVRKSQGESFSQSNFCFVSRRALRTKRVGRTSTVSFSHK